MKNNAKNKSLLELINNRISYLNTFLFMILFSFAFGFIVFYSGITYKNYIDEKLDFVGYQFRSIIRSALRDIENFAKNGAEPFSALVVIEVDLEGRVKSTKPQMEIYKDFYFANDSLFKKTMELGGYVSGFTQRFLTIDPVIAITKRYTDKVVMSLFSVKEIYENSEALQNEQQLFFVDMNGLGINVNRHGYNFVDFFAIESQKRKIPLLGLNLLKFNGQVHVFFQKELPYGFKSIISIPFFAFIKPYLYYSIIFLAFLVLDLTIVPHLLSKEIKAQLKPIEILSDHMVKTSGTTPIDLDESSNLSIEVKNLINSFNKMVRENNENRNKLSLAVKKLTFMNENMHSVNSLLLLSDEMFKKLILNPDSPLTILKEYISRVFNVVPSLKYFSYNGEFGNLEIGEKLGRLLTINHEEDKIQLAFEDSENEETIFFENTLAQEIANFIRDLKLAIQIQNLIRYDPLTKLPNRKYFDELFERELIIANRYRRILSFVLIDLDGFKTYNDTFGHQFGDKVLQEFAKVFRKSFRQSDIIGRFGGDEFQILMLETSKKQAYKKIQKLKEKTLSLEVEEVPVKLDFSFGIAEFPKDGKTKEELFKVADLELYKLKKLKRLFKEQSEQPLE